MRQSQPATSFRVYLLQPPFYSTLEVLKALLKAQVCWNVTICRLDWSVDKV